MHALIIENHCLISTLMEEALSELGYTSFDVADSEASAMKAAAARCPDLITADDRLAEGSGVAAVRTIYADRAIPVVFITGIPLEIDVPGAVKLAKPFRMQDLEQASQRAVACARTNLQVPVNLHQAINLAPI